MKRASLPWSVKQLVKMIDKGTISFELAAQRNRVWDLGRESLLIDSVLCDYPIPSLLATRHEGESGNVYYIVDGKQRGLTFKRFLNDEFVLEGLEELITEDGQIYELNGLTFSTLPEELKDIINTYSLTAHYLIDATEEEVNDIFLRENNGMPLTKFELTRVKASPLMPTITAITSHEVFSKFAISEKAKLRYTDQEIALQMLITCFDESPNFTGDYMQTWAEGFIITEQQQKHMQEVLEVFKYISTYGNEKAVKKVFKKVHISGLTYLINKYGRNNSSNFVAFVNGFFENRTVSSESYSKNSKAGSAKPEAIRKRFVAIDEYFQGIKGIEDEAAASDNSEDE